MYYLLYLSEAASNMSTCFYTQFVLHVSYWGGGEGIDVSHFVNYIFNTVLNHIHKKMFACAKIKCYQTYVEGKILSRFNKIWISHFKFGDLLEIISLKLLWPISCRCSWKHILPLTPREITWFRVGTQGWPSRMVKYYK